MSRLNFLSGIAIATWALLLVVVQAGNATNYYVDGEHPRASNTNPGTLDGPWSTIQYAAETAGAGDTVFLRGGIYHEHVTVERGGEPSAHLVFSAYEDETPVLDGTGVTESENGVVVAAPYVKLVGLEIRNWTGNGIWGEGAAFLEISDCVIHDVSYGIGLADGTHDFVLNGVEVHHFDLYGFDVSPSGGNDCNHGTFIECVAHTGRDRAQNVDGFALGHGTQHGFALTRCRAYDVFDGFDISARDTTLDRCLAYDCWNGAYKLWQDNVTLVNCVGHSSDGSIVELDWDGTPGVTTLVNCTFYGAEAYTVWVENAADTLHMYNCILAGGSNIGLAFEQRDIGAYRGDHNLFHSGNADRAIVVGYEDEFSLLLVGSGSWSAYSGQDVHSLITHVDSGLFVDAARFDLHLLPTSPAVDAGTDVDAPNEDYDGTERPRGAGYDVGAYEL